MWLNLKEIDCEQAIQSNMLQVNKKIQENNANIVS